MNYENLNHHNCQFSTGLADEITAGQGKLSNYGYWEIPCVKCLAEMIHRLKSDEVAMNRIVFNNRVTCPDGVTRDFIAFTMEKDQIEHCDWLPSDPGEFALWEHMCRSPMAQDDNMVPGFVVWPDGQKIGGFKNAETNEFIIY